MYITNAMVTPNLLFYTLLINKMGILLAIQLSEELNQTCLQILEIYMIEEILWHIYKSLRTSVWHKRKLIFQEINGRLHA